MVLFALEVTSDGPGGDLGAGGQAELGEDVGHVDGGRLRRDEQPLGELAVGQPEGEQRGDLALTRRQLAVSTRRRPLQPAGERLGPVAPHTWPPPQVDVDDVADRLQRRLAIAGTEQRLGERRAQRTDHRTGQARIRIGEHRRERRDRRSMVVLGERQQAIGMGTERRRRRVLGEPPVEHLRPDHRRRDTERHEVLDEHHDMVERRRRVVQRAARRRATRAVPTRRRGHRVRPPRRCRGVGSAAACAPHSTARARRAHPTHRRAGPPRGRRTPGRR